MLDALLAVGVVVAVGVLVWLACAAVRGLP